MSVMYYFSDPRCQFETGKIQLQTEAPFYEPGNLVKGLIWIHIDAPTAAQYIEIEVKGKEKMAFTRYWTEQDGDRTVERSERVKADKKFLEYKQPVFQVPGGFLQPGAYTVEFSFHLPMGLPASINMHDKRRRERPKAKVKYYIKAKLHNGGAQDMKYKQVIAIREPPVAFKMNDQQSELSEIKTWCCIDQGTSQMWSTFEKNIFTPQETARALIHVDNSKCTLNCSQVKFFIEQRMTLRGRGWGNHTYTFTKKLVER